MSCVHHGSVVSPPGHVLASIVQGEIDTSQKECKGGVVNILYPLSFPPFLSLS